MALDVAALLDGVVSPALASGIFDRVNTEEPRSAPGSGLSAAVWIDYIGPSPLTSGLASTSGIVRLRMRLYTSMTTAPTDMIDPDLLSATSYLLGLFSSGFTLAGAIRNVDLLGAYGPPLSGQAGYLNIGGTLMRIMDITIPCVVNDIWSQIA